MPYLQMFGSRATGGACQDSDIDVVITEVMPDSDLEAKYYTNEEIEKMIVDLIQYSLGNGGKLDLFFDDGMDFRSVYDSSSMILVGNAANPNKFIEHLEMCALPITVEEILEVVKH
jgi:hypothetical protein